jgi:IS5 family transposase
MIDEMHTPADGEKPRTYRRKARKDYLKTAKKRQKSAKEIRSAVKKQLQYIRRDLDIVNTLLENGKALSGRRLKRLETIKMLYEQQLFMHKNRTHKVENRIVSLSQPWVRPIVRGKAKSKCEFGAKLDISVSNGFARIENTSFDAYNESENLIKIIERHKARTGYYPERVLADGIYRNRGNLAFCKERGIQIAGKPLGRPKRDPDKAQRRREYVDAVDRIEVERKFSHAKGSFGLGLIRTKLKDTSFTAIALSIVALNLAHAGRLLHALFLRFFSAFSPLFLASSFCICSVGII